MQLGSAIVKTNPVDMIGKVPAISVPSENFKPAIPGSSSHSCNLHLEIKTFPDTMNVRGMSILLMKQESMNIIQIDCK